MDASLDLLGNYTLRTVALGSAGLGLLAGVLGVFASLRRQALLGDVMAHAALPGIVLGYLVTGSKSMGVLALGAAVSAGLSTLLVSALLRTTRLKQDAALGIGLSVFFGFGIFLLTMIQRRPDASQAGLDRFLFGQAATLVASDVMTLWLVAIASLALVAIFWKELKIVCFDPDFARCCGFPVRALDYLLMLLLVAAIVVGLQTVGVVLMSALLVAPAAAARQWTRRLGPMLLLAGGIGALSGISGTLIGDLAPRLPTGPVIVLVSIGVVVVSLLASPHRGIVSAALSRRRARHRFALEAVLEDLGELDDQHANAGHAHPAAVIAAMSGISRRTAQTILEKLAAQGFAERAGGASTADGWRITPTGHLQVQRTLARRSSSAPPSSVVTAVPAPAADTRSSR